MQSILTTVVGSYPFPDWLKVLPTRTSLRDATAVVLKTQELAGIDLLADGELYRFDPNQPDTNGMVDYFVRQMDGISPRLTLDQWSRFHRGGNLAWRGLPAGVVTGPVGAGTLNLPADYAFARELTRSPLKFTLTGPHMITRLLLDEYYGDPAELAMDVARILRKQVESIDADVVQIDEAAIPGNPSDREWAAAALNHVLEGVRGEKGVHVCFGNFGGQRVQKGDWQDLLPYLNSLAADHLILELARPPESSLDLLREIRPQVQLGVGVIDIKENAIETEDLVARRIERVAERVGADRIRYVHPDCGFWMLARSVADRKMRVLVAGRDRYLGLTGRIGRSPRGSI